MFVYQIKIALKSLRRNPILTTLLIAGIALGICVSTAFVTLRHLYTQDLLPGKSDRVFYVRLDSWGLGETYHDDPNSIPDQITYRDARGLLKSEVPVRQTPSYIANLFVHPDPKVARPFQPHVRLVYGDFFDIFNLKFRWGGPWTKAADAKPEQVVVIDHDTNERLFAGENSVGRTLRIEDRNYSIVGVLAPYRPPVRLWELSRNAMGPPEPIYIPFNMSEPLEIWSSGNNSGWKGETINNFQDMINSERVWLQYWVELPDAKSKAAYGDWLRSYIMEQKKLGRFQKEPRYALSTIRELIEEFKLIPNGVYSMSIVALLFLAVCSINLIGILLGKFLARGPEISVRRALGASRAHIFWQHIIECELIGLFGGALGIVGSLGILEILSRYMPNGDALRLNGEMLLLAAILSLVAGLVAGMYPAWRVCTVAPAMQLKVQ